MQGFWPIFFLLVVLKIPVLGSLGLVWWASRPPEDAYEPEPGTDESSEGFNRWRPIRPRPRGPHSQPGGGASLGRVRTRPAELVSDRRERVPRDGCEPVPSPATTRQTD